MMLPQRIAIVDDERSVRSGLINLLQSDGYATCAFESAEAFLNEKPRCQTLRWSLSTSS